MNLRDKLSEELYGEFVNMIGHHSPSLKNKIDKIVNKCVSDVEELE